MALFRATAPVSVNGFSSVQRFTGPSAVSAHFFDFIMHRRGLRCQQDEQKKNCRVRLSRCHCSYDAFASDSRATGGTHRGNLAKLEGKPSGGPVYVGQPLHRPFDGYKDPKILIVFPTAPVFHSQTPRDRPLSAVTPVAPRPLTNVTIAIVRKCTPIRSRPRPTPFGSKHVLVYASWYVCLAVRILRRN